MSDGVDGDSETFIVCGNPKRNSRTLKVAQLVANRIVREGSVEIVELADWQNDLMNQSSEKTKELVRKVRNARRIVVASPTYKASFTGLLKLFLDGFEAGSWNEKIVVPVMTAGGDKHNLVANTQLRPVLLELGACMPTQSVVVVESDMPNMEKVVDAWWIRETVMQKLTG